MAYEVREEERFGRFEEAWRGDEGLSFVPWGDLGEVCEVGFLELTGPVGCECECVLEGGEGEGEGEGQVGSLGEVFIVVPEVLASLGPGARVDAAVLAGAGRVREPEGPGEARGGAVFGGEVLEGFFAGVLLAGGRGGQTPQLRRGESVERPGAALAEQRGDAVRQGHLCGAGRGGGSAAGRVFLEVAEPQQPWPCD